MTLPLVSILIATYNHEDFIRETLQNVVEHDYNNLEIVVTDDGSTDRTQEIISEFAEKYPEKIVAILHRENAGISANHAKGLVRCTGKYVVIQDGDDVLLPGKIAQQVFIMEADSEVVISYHDVDVFESETNETLFIWSERIGTRTGNVRTLVRYGPFMCLISIMIRREWVPEYGYDDRLRNIGDWYLLVEVLYKSKGKIAYLDKVLARYRRHTKNVTSDWERKFTDGFLTLALIESQWAELVHDVRLRRSELYVMIAIYAWQNISKKTAIHLLGEAMRLSFPNPFPWWRLAWREGIYFLTSGRTDYLIKTLLQKKGREQL
ncbi:MAG: glycosyltransferase [Anaerolineae bacterium]|jgi:glycosyltransferase involved in cell wall biosynthesis|nr:glycosyltransferase [Candidatus Jacksonbacteria bacterium]MBT7070409.1 glycosyltransferase [Anaerolineae bacterium]MBT7601155.1 glycosyltransferase [Anaerolineae bacterium]MBT7990600.1 glycosyltransferase [Anaerolineae bacterium]